MIDKELRYGDIIELDGIRVKVIGSIDINGEKCFELEHKSIAPVLKDYIYNNAVIISENPLGIKLE